jgi:hypothetical protein
MPTMRCLSMVSSPRLSGTEQPVGPLPGPGLVLLLCWPQQPRSAVAPAPRTQRAYPRPEDRPPPATHLVSHPSSYPCGQAGNDGP